MAELNYLRDFQQPLVIQILRHRIAVLEQYAKQGAEPARQADSAIFGLQNSLKAYEGRANPVRDVLHRDQDIDF